MRRAIWMALAFMGTAPLVALAQQNTGAQAPAGSPSGTTSIERGQDTNTLDAPGAPGQQSAGTVGTAQGQPATDAAGPFGGTGGSATGAGAGMTGGQTGTGGGGAGGQASGQQAPLSGDAMQRELTTLRERVARLEEQVRDLGRGTGGAGTGGGGTTDTSNVRAQGPTVVATVTFDGTVRSVTSNRIQVVDREDGSVYNMRIDRGTRVSDDGKALNPRQLAEGTPVRASLAFIAGEEHARDIVVVDEETQRPRQQQQRQPGSSTR